MLATQQLDLRHCATSSGPKLVCTDLQTGLASSYKEPLGSHLINLFRYDCQPADHKLLFQFKSENIQPQNKTVKMHEHHRKLAELVLCYTLRKL